ncbi:hypothetical protein FLONG3_7324 [Fusarium longipes]|uniref:BTB domain-containing protein n=1 Tax=Fusarium longipes TaxID=694270 RepID=A0A395SEN5_9HYPO|nr:hypothetical protein FLONG3_7324 [Fusarium longipes]
MSASSSGRGQGFTGASRITKVCENGDIILAVGSKAKIQVASDFLKHISPVFEKMLDAPRSGEKALRNISSGSQVTIALPDDQPAAMERLLKILYGADHMRLDFFQVYTIILLADKYGMTDRLDYFSESWMREKMKNDDEHNWWHALVIAYMCNNQEYFAEVSGKLSKRKGSMAMWALTTPDRELSFKLALAIWELRGENKVRKSLGLSKKLLCLECFRDAEDSFTSKQWRCESDSYHEDEGYSQDVKG